MAEEKKVTFNIDKEVNFSDWFTEITREAELADIRYNTKGFVVFMPWSVMTMEKMYDYYEKALQKKGHQPLWFPTLIPEKNFKVEKEHVEGFTPHVFWVTEYGAGEKLEEKLALRPTSETAFYQMFAYWIRSYKDLPFKRYQRANVFRHETEATRPFMRSREFYWIETHNAFASAKDAEKQVKEDMQTTKEVMWEVFGVPFIFFKRPDWDKFKGAEATFAADSLAPSGRVIQQPSTHLLGQNFAKPFNVKFIDRKGNEKLCFMTCYGPAISRIYASVIAVHGDNKGLVFPWEIAPKQVVIVPIFTGKEEANKKVMKKARSLEKSLGKQFDVLLDEDAEKTIGEKFYYWEMKGIPIRLELGPIELAEESVLLFRRDTKEKIKVKLKELKKKIKEIGPDISIKLKEKASKMFEGNIAEANSLEELRKAINAKKIAKINFCSVDWNGEKCSLKIREETGATVRGIRMDEEEKPEGNCVICGQKAGCKVYVAKQY